VLELQEKIDPVQRARREGLADAPEQYFDEAKVAVKAFLQLMRELERTEKPTVSLALIEEARAVPSELHGEGDLALVMEKYHAIDRRLSVLEDYLGEAVSAYDAEIDRQIDMARGK
jgi:hypothetical protein